MLTFLRLVILICLAFSATNLRAGAQLDTIIELWLSGDDAESLPALSALAKDGNRLAGLLLARIETSDLGPSPFRRALTPANARNLFRDQSGGSLFGRTWITVAAGKGDPLALALRQSVHPTPFPELITELNALGEHQATDYPTRIVALYGTRAERDALRADPGLMSDLQPYLDYLSGPSEPRGDGVAALRYLTGAPAGTVRATDPDTLGMAGLLALGFGYGDISATNKWRAPVEDWLLSTPSTRPIADLCAASCAAEQGACAFAFLALSGGYYEAIRFDSPLENAIPQETYLSSPRARQTVLRRAALARAETNLKWLGTQSEIAQISQCAAALVTTERALYD